MAEHVRSCSLDSAAAAATNALQHLHQQYHVTAHVHPACLHYQPNSTSAAAADDDAGEEVTSAAPPAAAGSPASAGSAFLSRVQHQVNRQQQQHSPCTTNSPGAASSCASGSPCSSGSFGYFGNGQLRSQPQGSRGSYGAMDYSSSVGRSTGSSSATSAARGPDFTFKPAITRKAAAMKPRSVEDMSEGDRLRREAKLVSAGASLLLPSSFLSSSNIITLCCQQHAKNATACTLRLSQCSEGECLKLVLLCVLLSLLLPAGAAAHHA